MAWLQRRPQVSDPTNYYTVGANKTALLVGLGNPETKYKDTRHNIGFMCLDEFVEQTEAMGSWIDKKDLRCHLSTGQLGDTRVLAVKPTTSMNLSGEAVQAVMQFYKIDLEHTVVVYDELDINFGQIRLREGGSSAGHNGVKSVSQHVGEDYGRIRVGIGPKHPEQIDTVDFVLGQFSSDEQAKLSDLTREVVAIMNEYLYGSQKLSRETRSFLV